MAGLSIKMRLVFCFGMLSILLVFTGLLGEYGMSSSNDALEDAYSNQLSSAILVGKANLTLSIVRVGIERLLRHPDDAGTPALVKRTLEYLAVSDNAWHRYMELPRDADEKKLSDTVQDARDTYRSKALLPMIEAIKNGDRQAADSIAINLVPAFSMALSSKTDALSAYQVERGHERYEAAQRRSTILHGIVITMIALGLAASVACAISLITSISKPLAQTLEGLKRIAEGDLTGSMAARSRDEMGQLLKSVQIMQVGLTNLVRQVTRGAESINLATQEIAAGNIDLSQRTEEQAASLQETAASMEELSSIVKANAINAQSAQTLAAGATQIAAKGNGVMSDVVATMGEINRSSSKVVDIIEVIEGIALQTNILALNAAVEAARAGEQGRGFAVVAGEVRSLAQRSSIAAKEIKVLISESAERVETGSNLVGSAGKTMEQIQQAIDRLGDIVGEISTSSVEQSDAIEQVSLAMSQMDIVSQQNAALVEQAAAAAASLDQQAASLRKSVSIFRIEA